MAVPEIVVGDLLEQRVEVIVNAWNRNVIPWWLLLPQGVSGAIKRVAGPAPFQELAALGPIPLGGAVLTGAGRLRYRGIIHVAGLNMLWRATPCSVADCARSALDLAVRHGFASIAFPLIGAGTGGLPEKQVIGILHESIGAHPYEGRVLLVRHGRGVASGLATAAAEAMA
ncbi:macro domain-containing protein [Longimicrobium sp.]|uniref:macro domain-containing protein n=1 Tax=Longimicrobium sp. TaxID=2029185 RepID=UPI003B3BA912